MAQVRTQAQMWQLYSEAELGNQSAVLKILGLALNGDAAGEYFYGELCFGGNSVPKDDYQGKYWTYKSAAQGYAPAESALGDMIEDGTFSFKQSYSEAVTWHQMAAKQGDDNSQYHLALMYENGVGVEQNEAMAMLWFRKAADQGNPRAKTRLDGLNALKEQLPRTNDHSVTAPQSNADARKNVRFVPLSQQGGVYTVPVRINDAINLGFVLDSGSADVSIPAEVVLTLKRTGTIAESDFIGSQTYTLADGSQVASKTFRIRSLKLGDIVVENVTGSVAKTGAGLLLGQSFLSRFKSWSVDNAQHVLVLE